MHFIPWGALQQGGCLGPARPPTQHVAGASSSGCCPFRSPRCLPGLPLLGTLVRQSLGQALCHLQSTLVVHWSGMQ